MTVHIDLDAETFSASLDWKEFEFLAELAFKSFGYETKKNYRMKNPRLEIDLLAFSNKIAFAVDCKHWKRTAGHATMIKIAETQIKRCEKLLAQNSGIRKVVPMILTWHDEYLLILENGVAVVPIQKISDFLLNWDTPSEKIRRIEKDGEGLTKEE